MMPRRINCSACGKWHYEGQAKECDCPEISIADQMRESTSNRKERRTEWAMKRKLFRP